MYLKSARLQDWGCHDKLVVDFHEEINICVGRNGAGKSTLYHAIVAALTVKHSSKHADLSRFLSWGREGFGPTASLDLVRDDGHWNLEKTFLHGPRCLLKRPEGSTISQSFNGARAEQELDGWLEGDGAAGRLILTLWSRQDSPIEYQEIPGARSASLGTLLEKAIARASLPESAGPFGALKKKFADEYDARFTREFKRIKTGSDLHEAILRRDEARAHRDELLRRRDDLAAKVEAFRVRSARHGDDCRDREELRRRKVEREHLARDYRDKAEALKRAEATALALRAESESLRIGHDRLATAEAELSRSVAKLGDFAASIAEAQAGLDEAEAAMKAARTRSEKARPLLDELINAFEQHRRVAEAAESLKGRRDSEHEARAEFDRAKDELRRADADLAAAVEASGLASRSLADATRARLERDRLDAERASDEAESNHRLALAADLARRRSSLRDRLDKVRACSRALAEVGDDEPPLPSTIERDALVAEDQALSNLEGAIEADALTARIEADIPLSVRFSAEGEPADVRRLVGGEAAEGRAVSSLTIEIEGVGRIAIGRTSVDPAGRLERLRVGRLAISDRLRGWGVADIAGLDGRLRREKERRDTLDRLAILLDGRGVDELEEALDGLDDDLRDLGIGPGDPPPAPPIGPGLADLERRKNAAQLAAEKARAASEADPRDEPGDPGGIIADPAELRIVEQAASRAVEEATRRSRRAEVDLARAESGLVGAIDRRAEAEGLLAEETSGDPADHFLSKLRSRIREIRVDLEWARAPQLVGETRSSAELIRNQLEDALQIAQADLDRARDRWSAVDAGRRDADRDLVMRSAAIERLRRTADLELDPAARRERLADREGRTLRAEAEARLLREALPPDPEADRESFEGLAREAEERCHRGDVALEGLRVEINTQGAEGLDTSVARAEERFERCESKVARLQADASAWALLHHLLAEVEAEQSRGVARRLQALAAPRVSSLTGGMVGEAILDPRNLVPSSARVDGLASNPGLDQFSRGTREQVALACRLQIGLLLSEGRSRHVLLLDDPLAHTDPPRLEAALEMFRSLRDKLQFIIFTCHEDRYRSMGDAARFHDIG